MPSAQPLPQLKASALRVNVVEALRHALVEGRFQPGEDLADSKLAKAFGVSRGPVREALLLLAQEGLVEHPHYRGFRVPALTRRDIFEITRARRPLEVLALGLARERATAADVRELRRLKKTLLVARRSGPPGATALPDYAFHQKIWALSGDRWLEAALLRLCTAAFVHISLHPSALPLPSLALLDERHERFIHFVAGKADETAEACVAFHLGPPEALAQAG